VHSVAQASLVAILGFAALLGVTAVFRAQAALDRQAALHVSGPEGSATGPLALFQAERKPVSRPESAPGSESAARSDAKPVSTFAERAQGSPAAGRLETASDGAREAPEETVAQGGPWAPPRAADSPDVTGSIERDPRAHLPEQPVETAAPRFQHTGTQDTRSYVSVKVIRPGAPPSVHRVPRE
jgi:hypothetical protein